MKTIEIDKGSGFCFGVVTAIKKTEEELAKGETLYCLGDIVHNNREVERLKTMGLITINHEDFKKLRNAKVLLRAHGEPPETYETARLNNIDIIDATCPVVLRLQKKIKQKDISEEDENKQIVIYGKNGHAEVLGLVGQTAGKAIVIENLEEAKQLDFKKNICLYSQTTKSLEEFQKIVEYIKEHISPNVSFEYHDTICRQVVNRIPNIRTFAASHDLIFLVSGNKSSNGKILFNECKKINPNSFLIESADEIDKDLLDKAQTIGICGATSTPKWLMEEISEAIKSRI
ncbi:MAG: 4-hydroxy-3-methylbut-2-enyl diphosphate reductase [Bacteroides sp.]|jgi:4-hydroxy-3-methylbut-2-enyl diphosphate reductase|nr:4-hydroxy-3-methylbut-2-enyl diphosphate reductase [Bacteroides sp.]